MAPIILHREVFLRNAESVGKKVKDERHDTFLRILSEKYQTLVHLHTMVNS